MKNTMIIIVSLAVGTIAGAGLGFFIPFGIAHLAPEHGPALSFVPILSVPEERLLEELPELFSALGKFRENLN